MDLQNTPEKDFYLDTAYEISSSLGYPYTREDLEKLAIESDYLLHLEPINNDHLHIGIYAVGNWQYQDTSTNCPDCNTEGIHRPQYSKDFDILVFACHEWADDDFKYSYSNNKREIIYNETDAENVKNDFIREMKFYQKNPIKAYYDLVDFDEFCLCHKSQENRVVVYYKAWFKNVILKKFSRKK